ncbi:MAG: glycosyltransferase [Leptolyngbya sp. SIO1D8]|nr:glycosyltransferase [Leptolyngbya sp. SIO1D8]
MPAVSIVIPVYNGEKTIEATIASVLAQSFEDFELLIINDGSNDSTLEIVNSIADARLQVLSYPNVGLAASRNRGIRAAVGEFISFIDADDLWTPDKLLTQVEALRQNPQAALVYSWTDCVNDRGRVERRGSYITAEGNVYAQLLLGNFLDSGSNALVRREVFETTGGFDESLKAAEDWDMFLRLARSCEFVCVSKVQVLYRLSNQSMSANLDRQEQESLKVLQRAYAACPNLSVSVRHQSLGSFYRYLSFKALEGTPDRKNGFAALRYLGRSVRHHPSQIRPVRLFLSQLAQARHAILRRQHYQPDSNISG